MTTRAIADLERALAQQDEPAQDQRCRAEPRSDGDFVCDCKIGDCLGRSAALAQQKDPTDPGNDVDVLREHVRHLERRVRQLQAHQAEPTRSQQMVAAGFKPRDRRLECDECGGKFTAQMLPIHKCAQQAEAVAGKVVAWGVFANIDGEWQLQHPVFAGDEQGKVNAEFERASYSGPQPLEVRPLGVVTATARQAEPAQEPVATLIAQRDALLEALKAAVVGAELRREGAVDVDVIRAAIKAAEGEKT